jgi:autotransporter-associated beta strand protein
LGGELADVEAHGGIFAPYDAVRVRGSLRMLEGSTFVHTIDNGQYGPIVSYAAVDHEIELSNCNFSLIVASVPFNMNEFPVLVGNPLMGTFNGFSEGQRFFVGSHLFTITYTNGVRLFFNQPFVWDGGGIGNAWSTAANWVGDFAPPPNFTLVFPPGVSKVATVNDFAPGTRFHSLSFLGPSYTISGNSFALLRGIFTDSASGETLIRSDITLQVLASPNELRVGNSNTLRLEGSLTGGPFSVWQKTGPGTLSLGGTAANTQYRFEAIEGELELAKSPGVNAISGDLVIGDGTNSPVVRLMDDHQIADTAEVEINRPARFELNGNNEVIERLEGNGTVELSERLQRLGRLTVESGFFSGSLIGGGGLTKVGMTSTTLLATSVLDLRGTNTFTGPTILSGGLLQVNGSQTNSPIRLDGGVLGGHGFVGTITAGAGGLVDPGTGNAPSDNTLRSRSVAFNPATTLRSRLRSRDPGFENHKLQVAGSVSLGGSALDFILLSFIPAPGDRFMLIDNDGTDAVVGTFAGLPEGAVFTRPTPNLRWRITYTGGDGNDVVLTLVDIDFRPAITSFAVRTGSVPGVRFFTFSASAVPSAYYDVEASTNLLNWTRLFSVTTDLDGMLGGSSSLSQPPFFSQRFFRFKWQPLEAPGAED